MGSMILQAGQQTAAAGGYGAQAVASYGSYDQSYQQSAQGQQSQAAQGQYGQQQQAGVWSSWQLNLKIFQSLYFIFWPGSFLDNLLLCQSFPPNSNILFYSSSQYYRVALWNHLKSNCLGVGCFSPRAWQVLQMIIFEHNDSMTCNFGILHLLLPLISFALERRHFKWNLWY